MGNSRNYEREMLNHIRDLMQEQSKSNRTALLKEDSSDKKLDDIKAIAITDDIKFGDHVLSNQINEFRSAVSGGAEFAEANPDNPAESPLIYLPKNGNIVFSGTIPAMNNLEFQMVLKTSTGNGCFIWGDGLILSNENIKLLVKMQGYYENWKDSWYQAARELESLKNMEA